MDGIVTFSVIIMLVSKTKLQKRVVSVLNVAGSTALTSNISTADMEGPNLRDISNLGAAEPNSEVTGSHETACHCFRILALFALVAKRKQDKVSSSG